MTSNKIKYVWKGKDHFEILATYHDFDMRTEQKWNII